jgi:formylmethanofuran dehydrogenase subunit E
MKDIDQIFQDAVVFHGHACPGLAIGVRVAIIAREVLSAGRAEDEDLVCIAETDACGVDGIQFVSGCTAGKGNLIIHNYGKQAFSFLNRATGKAVRVAVRPEAAMDARDPEGWAARMAVFAGTATPDQQAAAEASRERMISVYLHGPQEEVYSVTMIPAPEIPKAKIQVSVICACCGEPVMPARAVERDGTYLCIPCSEAEVPKE